MSKISSMVFCLFIIIVSFSPGQLARAEKQNMGDFSITLPDGWSEISRETIDTFEAQMKELSPNKKKHEHYDYGFSAQPSDAGFSYPYSLFQIKNSGRLSQDQFSEFNKLDDTKVADQLEKDFSGVLTKMSTGKMLYDEANNIIWMKIEFEVNGVGPVRALCGMIPTEKGFINAYCYSLVDEWDIYKNDFKDFIKSLKPSPELEYKHPSFLSFIDWSKVIVKGIAGALIALVIGLFARFKK